ncbi:MAG: tetratricopeptide repeat protein [Phycisphaerae bacterium]|nr:tetratricopeptide repeat protein [Phycisphaerae bacterium]
MAEGEQDIKIEDESNGLDPQEVEEQAKKARKAKVFFDRADEVAGTGNWDFAIELYSEGLKLDPDEMERGHKKLRDVALKRKMQGGKAAGMGDRRKHKPGKEPAVNLANAGYLLAKDPGSEALMEMFLKSALEVGNREVIRWIGEIMLESQKKARKPNRRVCTVIMDGMAGAKHFDLAVQACNLALTAAPNDPELENRLGDLGAEYTLQKGQYGVEGDFTKGVKDLDKQKELIQKDMLVKDEEFLRQQIAKAEQDYLEAPTVPGKINGYVDALLKFEDESYENQAIDVLNKAFQDTKAYQFKMRVGDVKIRQMSRRFRKLKDAGDKDGATQAAREQLTFEVREYRERATNYPTDLSLKYELGRRLFLAGEYDDAIGYLQQAQRDPRRFVVVMNYLGQAFMRKEWWQEAIDTFERVLQGDVSEDRSKDIRYNLGLCYEQLGKLEQAQEQLSRLAQIDFNYKDVRARLEAIRKRIQEKNG